MTRSLLAPIALAGAMALAGTAQAQRPEGVYLAAGLGASWLAQTNASVFPPDSARLATPSDLMNRKWDVGHAGTLALGYGLPFGLRAELEGFHRQNRNGTGSAFTRPASSGIATTYGLMANLLFDIPLGGLGQTVRPYLGAGFGYAWTDWSSVRGAAGSARLALDDTDGTFAFQGILGMAFPLPAIPGLALTAEYRYFGTTDNPMIGGRVSDAASGESRRVSVPVATSSHNAMIGLRYHFGQAAPAPAPAAMAPAPARSFLVFFDWNRAELTARARQIIAEAAQARTTQPLTRIEVNGHTDTSGSARYNQGLSERRAAAVAAELVRLGVPRHEIVTRGLGQTQPLVPTPDNTREPQNRRVEIILR
jgi:outer membrane protein OmpA-like peptidoglycan-associated protein/outer membrane protein W